MSTTTPKPKVAVIQDGARLHYAIPIALKNAGLLHSVFTDWYSAPASFSRLAARLIKLARPDQGRRMLDRYNPNLNGSNIISTPTLTWKTLNKRKTFPNDRAYYLWEAKQRADWI